MSHDPVVPCSEASAHHFPRSKPHPGLPGSQSVSPNTSRSYVPAFSALNMTFSSQSVSSWTQNNRPHFSRLPIHSRVRCAFPAEDASALDRASRPRSNAASSVSPDPSFLRVPEDKHLYLEGRRGWGSQRCPWGRHHVAFFACHRPSCFITQPTAQNRVASFPTRRRPP